VTSNIDRKIAVIFVADVVGYSKHMEKDEDATINSYNSCEKILHTLLKKYKGSVFNTAGDSVLAEFPSAVNAVECGVEFQKEIKKRNNSQNEAVKLEFRLGINMGDVVAKDSNLIGDGVNIAARLEALAQPNGISISKSVYDFVVPKTKMTFNDLGVQKVKQNEFHAFDILLDPSQKRTLKNKNKMGFITVGVIAALLIIGFLGYSTLSLFKGDIKQELQVQKNKNSLPTILVKPFQTLGSDNSSVGTALTEGVISILSKYNGINVLSSSTSFNLLEKDISDDEIGKNFGVNYLIKGSVQAFGEQSRLTVELYDFEKRTISWSDLLDFQQKDIFKVQDDLGTNLLVELQVNMVEGQSAKKWLNEFETAEAYTLFLNHKNEWRRWTPEGYNKHIELFDELKKLSDNQYVLEFIEGWTIFQRILLGLSQNKEEDIARLDYISNNIVKTKGNDDAHLMRAEVEFRFLSKDCDVAISHINEALSINSINPDVLKVGAILLEKCGMEEKAVGLNYEALRLMPNDVQHMVKMQLAPQLYMLDRKDEIKTLLKDVLNDEFSNKTSLLLILYAALEAESGNLEEAKKLLARANKAGLKISRLQNWKNGEIYPLIKPYLDEIGYLNQ
jgi:class 3 adenylate cyclase/TolB-like protein